MRKSNQFRFVAIVVLFGSITDWQAPAAAATIAADGSAVGVSAIPTGTIANSGWVLFDANGTGDVVSGVAAPGGYAANIDTTGDVPYSDNSYTTLTASGTPYQTGVIYKYPVAAGPYFNLATITLGSNTPPDFILSVLQDNATNSNNDDRSLQVFSGASSATVTTAGNNSGQSPSNDFYSFLVTGAAPGDTITVAASTVGVTALIGGLGFTTVPEPGACVLASLGFVALLMVVRRRRNV